MRTHYDETYTNWHDKIEIFGAILNLDKFASHIELGDFVLDFGCGSGQLLKNIDCSRRYGIEINQAQRERAEEKGILVSGLTKDIRKNTIDVVISNHALEHCPNPYEELLKLRGVLKVGGKIIVCVPFEGLSLRHRLYDKEKHNNFHLYTWNEETLGNLFHVAGFNVISCKEYKHKWIPKYQLFYRILGKKGFDILCSLYARISRSTSQILIVAER